MPLAIEEAEQNFLHLLFSIMMGKEFLFCTLVMIMIQFLICDHGVVAKSKSKKKSMESGEELLLLKRVST